MAIIIGLLLILALAVLPTLWVKAVLARHNGDRPDFPGTGGELARHLLDGMGLHTVKVEETALGDHYDPELKAVRLTPSHFHGRSLTAVVIAAHEVGHAMQDATGSGMLRMRTRLAKAAMLIEMVGSVVMLAAPLLGLVLRHPVGLFLQLGAGFAILSVSVALHAAALPNEFDASFNRALPVLRQGRYIHDDDLPAARSILRAAAFTYVAAALMSLVNIARWLRILRI